jgi:hypothetical protein
MARDTVEILRSTVPLLRPRDRCPGEIYINFADRIFGVIGPGGEAIDIGPLVFETVAGLAAYDDAVTPPNGVLAFADDAFYLKEAGGTAAGLPGWRKLALGGGGGGDPPYDDTELRELIAEETRQRIAGDQLVTETLTASITVERTARIAGDEALAQEITTLEASVVSKDAATNARITQESTVRADADSALAEEINELTASVLSETGRLDARVTSESQARVEGDVALGIRIDNIEVGGGYDDTELRALISTESQARVSGDEALASQITTLSATVEENDEATNARITEESLARVAGDEALASRTTTLEVFRTDVQQSGGNLLQNALLTLGEEPWDFLGTEGWVIEERTEGPAEFVFVTRAPGTVRANNSEYLPVPSQRLDFEVWMLRAPGTVGEVLARLELGSPVGQPLPALIEVVGEDIENNVLTRIAFSFDLPETSGVWRLALVSDVSAGSIELSAPYLGLRGRDYSADINELGASIAEESVARIAGDTALASRATTLEAFRADREQAGGNLIDDALQLLGGGSWVRGGWNFATRTDAPAARVFTCLPSGDRALGANLNQFRPPVLRDFTVRFWLREFASTTGTGLSVQIRIQRRGAGNEVFESFRVAPTGANLQWAPYAFRVALPDDCTGWRIEFVCNIATGRYEMCAPYAGVSTGDAEADLSALSARITEESLARVAGDEALASRATTLEAEAVVRRVQSPIGISDTFSTYADSEALRRDGVIDLDEPTGARIILRDGLMELFSWVPNRVVSRARLPIRDEGIYRVSFDVEAFGGAVGIDAGIDGGTSWRGNQVAANNLSLAAGERRTVEGYFSGNELNFTNNMVVNADFSDGINGWGIIFNPDELPVTRSIDSFQGIKFIAIDVGVNPGGASVLGQVVGTNNRLPVVVGKVYDFAARINLAANEAGRIGSWNVEAIGVGVSGTGFTLATFASGIDRTTGELVLVGRVVIPDGVVALDTVLTVSIPAASPGFRIAMRDVQWTTADAPDISKPLALDGGVRDVAWRIARFEARPINLIDGGDFLGVSPVSVVEDSSGGVSIVGSFLALGRWVWLARLDGNGSSQRAVFGVPQMVVKAGGTYRVGGGIRVVEEVAGFPPESWEVVIAERDAGGNDSFSVVTQGTGTVPPSGTFLDFNEIVTMKPTTVSATVLYTIRNAGEETIQLVLSGIFFFEVSAIGNLRVHGVTVSDATPLAASVSSLSARIVDESIARVAGDTALAQRSTVLEAQTFQSRSDGQNIIFGAYNTVQEMADAGWEFIPPLPPRGTPEVPFQGWWLVSRDTDGGGKNLRYDGPTAPEVWLLAPRVAVFGDPWRPETHRARWFAFRDNAADDDWLTRVGWQCLNNAGQVLVSDLGPLSYQAGFNKPMVVGDATEYEGYSRGMAGVGLGNNVGAPAPSILAPSPLPFGTTFFRPMWQGFFANGPRNINLEFVRADYGRVSGERDLKASITTESTARASGDEALAQQIQQIIATEAKGTQTFYQATAPLNPEPGWLWFRDTGPGVPDEIFRWNGMAWVRIDTAQANDLSALQAEIRDESIARVNGDIALAQRTSSLEATALSQQAAIDGVAGEVDIAKASVVTESQARAAGDQAQASRSALIESNVNGVSARVTVNEESINGIKARYSVQVDAGGRVAGLELLAGGGQSAFNILADIFRVFNPDTGTDEPVFTVSNGRVFIREAFIPLLSTSSLKIDDVVLDTNAEGELTVKQLGVTTNLLAPNATNAAYAYSQIVAGSGVGFPRNVWNTISLNGVPATVRITNGPVGGALVKFDVNLLVRNFGANSDVASFRILRSDGLVLPTQYTGMYIDDTPNNAFGNQAMTFFDIGLAPGANFTYTFQMNSNEESPVRALHIFGMLFKNSQAAPYSAPIP